MSSDVFIDNESGAENSLVFRRTLKQTNSKLVSFGLRPIDPKKCHLVSPVQYRKFLEAFTRERFGSEQEDGGPFLESGAVTTDEQMGILVRSDDVRVVDAVSGNSDGLEILLGHEGFHLDALELSSEIPVEQAEVLFDGLKESSNGSNRFLLVGPSLELYRGSIQVDYRGRRINEFIANLRGYLITDDSKFSLLAREIIEPMLIARNSGNLALYARESATTEEKLLALIAKSIWEPTIVARTINMAVQRPKEFLLSESLAKTRAFLLSNHDDFGLCLEELAGRGSKKLSVDSSSREYLGQFAWPASYEEVFSCVLPNS